MDDKTYELIQDEFSNALSDCCGAPIIQDICSDCKEHCEPQQP